MRSIILPLLLTACASPDTVCGIRADYDGQCSGDGTVVLRYHFGATDLPSPRYGETRCWMLADGTRMCRMDLNEPRARFSDGCELMRLGHEACHVTGGNHE